MRLFVTTNNCMSTLSSLMTWGFRQAVENMIVGSVQGMSLQAGTKKKHSPVLALILGKWMLIRITEILQDLNHTYNWVVVSSPHGLVRSLKTVEHDRLVRSNKKSEPKYHLYVGPFHKQTSWFYQHSFIGFVTTKLLPGLDGWKHSVQTFTPPLFL